MGMYDDNIVKIGELQSWARWGAIQWLDDSFGQNKTFKILEAYRPQERQNILFCKGRDRAELDKLLRYGYISLSQHLLLTAILAENPHFSQESRVTWTLSSEHTKRLALDISPINCSFDDLASIGSKYGISNPLPEDRWHFEFKTVVRKPLFILSSKAKIASLDRGIARSNEPTKSMLVRLKERILRRSI